jgi:hypothetical protein
MKVNTKMTDWRGWAMIFHLRWVFGIRIEHLNEGVFSVDRSADIGCIPQIIR